MRCRQSRVDDGLVVRCREARMLGGLDDDPVAGEHRRQEWVEDVVEGVVPRHYGRDDAQRQVLHKTRLVKHLCADLGE